MSADKAYWLVRNCPAVSFGDAPSVKYIPDWLGKQIPAEDGVREACRRGATCRWECGTLCNSYKTVLIQIQDNRDKEEKTWLVGVSKDLRKKPKSKKRDVQIRAIHARMLELM